MTFAPLPTPKKTFKAEIGLLGVRKHVNVRLFQASIRLLHMAVQRKTKENFRVTKPCFTL